MAAPSVPMLLMNVLFAMSAPVEPLGTLRSIAPPIGALLPPNRLFRIVTGDPLTIQIAPPPVPAPLLRTRFRSVRAEPAANRLIPPPQDPCWLPSITLPMSSTVPAPRMGTPPPLPPEQPAWRLPLIVLFRIVAAEKAASIPPPSQNVFAVTRLP